VTTTLVNARRQPRRARVERIAERHAKTLLQTHHHRKGRANLHPSHNARDWNRLGRIPVHVALLTIFFGGFMTAQFGRNRLDVG
jgi:hypothetical protein